MLYALLDVHLAPSKIDGGCVILVIVALVIGRVLLGDLPGDKGWRG